MTCSRVQFSWKFLISTFVQGISTKCGTKEVEIETRVLDGPQVGKEHTKHPRCDSMEAVKLVDVKSYFMRSQKQ